MQASAAARRTLDVPAVVCAAISLAVAYGYTRMLSWAADAEAHPARAGVSPYLNAASGLLQVGRVLMVAAAVLLVLRAADVRIPSKVTRGVFTGGMLGLPVCYVMLRWDGPLAW
jgi:hypothetical protein